MRFRHAHRPRTLVHLVALGATLSACRTQGAVVESAVSEAGRMRSTPAMFPVADAEPEVQIPGGPPFTGDTAEYVVLVAGRAVGRLRQWPDTAGSNTTSFSYADRSRGPSLLQTLRLDKAGLPVAMQVSGTSVLKIPIR